MGQQLIALDADSAETAGSISYWALAGDVNFRQLIDALELDGVHERYWPTEITLGEALVRAARACSNGRRQLVRPLGTRGAWALVQEHVTGEESVEHTQLLTGKVAQHGGVQVIDIRVSPGVEVTAALEELVDQIREECVRKQSRLAAADVSGWLVRVATQLHATGLRDRGGIYFMPRDVLPEWRRVARVLSEESEHKVFMIPAMKTDEAVEAILSAVRSNVEEKFSELEGYLAAGVSTKGLNVWERHMADTRSYLDHYVRLLGQALPDLSERLELFTGALTAARITAKEKAA